MVDSLRYKVFNFFANGEASSLLCRICFVRCKNSQKYSFLHDEICLKSEYFNGVLSIFNILEIVTNYKVETESASNAICHNCVDALLSSFLNLKKCLNSDKKWRQLYEQFKGNFQDDIVDELKPDSSQLLVYTADEDIKPIIVKPNDVIKNEFIEDASERCECCNMYTAECKKIKRSQTNQKQQCQKCNGIYKNKRSFRRHLKLYCGEGKPLAVKDYTKYFTCLVCTRRYKRKDSLYKHQKAICYKDDPSFLKKKSKEKLIFVCEYCGLRLLTQRGYQEHIIPCAVKHTNDDNVDKFICDLCDAVFYIKRSLIHHWRNTHVDKTIPCDVCGKLFKTINRVQAHMITHTKERNFKCDTCENVFVTKHALRYHIRLHTGEKPYFCNHCDERFISASRRMAHMRRKHLEPEIPCEICDMKLATRSDLAKHEKKHLKDGIQIMTIVPRDDEDYVKLEEVDFHEIIITAT